MKTSHSNDQHHNEDSNTRENITQNSYACISYIPYSGMAGQQLGRPHLNILSSILRPNIMIHTLLVF